VHNSRRPLDHLFALCDPVTLTFDLILIDGRGIVVDCPCTKFDDFFLSAVLVFVVRKTESQTDRITDSDDRYTHATPVGVNK